MAFAFPSSSIKSKCNTTLRNYLCRSNFKIVKLCLRLWGDVCVPQHTCVEMTRVCCLACALVMFSCFRDLHVSGKCTETLPQHWQVRWWGGQLSPGLLFSPWWNHCAWPLAPGPLGTSSVHTVLNSCSLSQDGAVGGRGGGCGVPSLLSSSAAGVLLGMITRWKGSGGGAVFCFEFG